MYQDNNTQSNNNTGFNFVHNTSNSNNNTVQLDNIFNIQPKNDNNQLNNQGNNLPNLVPEQPKFNIKQVYEKIQHS